MRIEDIKLKQTYSGGKNDELRTVVSWGSSKTYVVWAPTRERLPLGGFERTRCTTTESFAKWANATISD